MEWISVNDRLPKNAKNSFYFSDLIFVMNGKRKLKAKYQTERKYFFGWTDSTPILTNVTHWMPLPLPPNK